ncbi:SMEK domain-containing protein, partial [Staphylococcus aureus]
MKRSTNQEKFLDTLIRLNTKIEELGKINILNNHIYSEYFFRDLLNIVYGYSLENHNKKQKNAPAFDLIDNTNKIIIQVTATCKKQKIEDTLKKEYLTNKMEEGYRLKFIFIGNQNNNIKNKNFSNPHNILFDSKKDIILTQDLCEEFLNLNINKQDHAIELLKKELSPLLFEDSLSYLKEEFINEKLEFNISNLASRYTANNDVDTINNKIIEGISITNNFKYTNISYLKELKGYIENDILDKMKSKYAKNIYLNFKKIFSNLEQSVNNYLELEEEFEEKKKYLSEIYELIDEINIDPYIFLTEHNE